MRGMFATKDSTVFCHIGLDKRMPNPRFDGATPGSFHNLGHHFGGDEVIDNHGCGFPGSLGTCNLPDGHHCGDRRWRDGFTCFIDYETPVSITIKSQAKIGVMMTNSGLQIDQILGLDRVSWVVWKSAI